MPRRRMGATSVTKRFAKFFNGSGRKRISAPPKGKSLELPKCVLKKQRMAWRVIRWQI